jgi:chemotaxis protein MotB
MNRARRRHEPNADRWLISYADFITLLFAFFVVMYAVSQANHGDTKALSESVKRALEGAAAEPAPSVSKLEKSVLDDARSLAEAHRTLENQLARQIAAGELDVVLDPRGVVISLREKGFFPSGGDQVYPKAWESLEKVANVIRDLPNAIRLEGHTDATPIHNARFHSNWDLSAARSIAVLTFLQERCGLEARRFTIAGHADNRPIGDNDSEEGRARNRRVDLLIVSAKQ